MFARPHQTDGRIDNFNEADQGDDVGHIGAEMLVVAVKIHRKTKDREDGAKANEKQAGTKVFTERKIRVISDFPFVDAQLGIAVKQPAFAATITK